MTIPPAWFGLFLRRASLAGALLGASLGGGAQATSPLVECYDEARDLVRTVRAEHCAGRIVDATEAAALRARRAEYVREGLARAQGAAVPGKRLVSIGSGFFVSGDGRLLTNRHVVRDCAALTVSTAAGASHPATVRAVHASIDLAVLDTEARPVTSALFAPPDAILPSQLAIVGYPNQGIPPLRPLLTAGRLLSSATPATPPRPLLIAADIRPGHSGGPAFDSRGRVVGVVFAAVDTPKVYAETGRTVRQLGVAIPNALVVPFLAQAGVTARTGTGAAADGDALERARPLMARVECWR